MTDEQYQLLLRRRARSKMVYIDASIPDPDEEGELLHCCLAGTIVCAKEDFLYVVVPRDTMRPHVSFHVVLPDGSQIDITSDGFSKVEAPGARLSGFYIKHTDVAYDIQQISAAEFGSDVSLFEEVYLCDFVDGNFNMTGGQVIDTDGVTFIHTCGATLTTTNGAPVLSVDSRLVGISFGTMQGPIAAMPRATLEKEVNKIVDSKDLRHFIALVHMGAWD